MTDITELAQREKFEAWAEERCALPWGYLKNRRTNTGYFSKHDYTSLWTAWKAAGAELVEALEKAQQYIARQEQIILNQDESLSIRRGELEKAQKSNEFLKGQLSELANFNPDWDKLEASYESWREIAAELLVAKDRIAELESRTVTVKLPDYRNTYKVPFADEVEHQVRLALELFSSAAGIKWEAE